MGSRLCGMHISETDGRIYFVRSSMGLSRYIVLESHCHFSCMGLPIRKKSSNRVLMRPRLCGVHISETTQWISSIPSSMEFTTPVVVQPHYVNLPIWRMGQHTYLWSLWPDFLWKCLDLHLCNIMAIWPIWVWPWSQMWPIWVSPLAWMHISGTTG